MQRTQAEQSRISLQREREIERTHMLIDWNDATSLSLPLSRDIQPSSMLIDHAENVKLCDFCSYG